MKTIRFYILCMVLTMFFVSCRQDEKIADIVAIYCYPEQNIAYPLDLEYVNGEWMAWYQGTSSVDNPIRLKLRESQNVGGEEFLYDVHEILHFDEIIDGAKNGEYRIYVDKSIGTAEIMRVEYIKEDKTITFYPSAVIKRHSLLSINPDNLKEAEYIIANGTSTLHYSNDNLPIGIQQLLYVLHHNPQTITYPFDTQYTGTYVDEDDTVETYTFQAVDTVVTSQDGLLRFYHYCYFIGGNGAGSFPQNSPCQYISNGKVITIDDFEESYIWPYAEAEEMEFLGNCNFGNNYKIHLYDAVLSGHTYYLVEFAYFDEIPMFFDEVYWAQKAEARILFALNICNGKLKFAPIFNGKSHIEVCFENGQSTSFLYNNPTKTLKVPLVNQQLIFTKKYLTYQWNGKQFVYKGVTQ